MAELHPSVVVPHAEAQAVAAVLAVLQLHRRVEGVVGALGQQAAAHQADVPAGERARRHAELGRAEQPAGRLLHRRTDRAVAPAGVGPGVARRQRLLVGVDHTLHVQRLEDMGVQKAHQWLARHLLDDGAGHHEAGVGILPVRSRFEVERAARPFVHDRLDAGRAGHFGGDVVLRPEVPEARGMAERLAYGDAVRLGEVGEEAGDVIVQTELALLLQLQDRRGGEFLGDAVNGVARLGGRRLVRQAGRSIRLGVGQLAAAHHSDGNRGRAGLGQPFADAGVDLRLLLGAQRSGPGRGRAGHGGREDDNETAHGPLSKPEGVTMADQMDCARRFGAARRQLVSRRVSRCAQSKPPASKLSPIHPDGPM